MVAMTVAIAATVYVYVSDVLGEETPIIEGTITDKIISGSPGYNNLDYWFIIDNSFEVEITIGTFYSFEIGDYYTHIE